MKIRLLFLQVVVIVFSVYLCLISRHKLLVDNNVSIERWCYFTFTKFHNKIKFPKIIYFHSLHFISINFGQKNHFIKKGWVLWIFDENQGSAYEFLFCAWANRNRKYLVRLKPNKEERAVPSYLTPPPPPELYPLTYICKLQKSLVFVSTLVNLPGL